MGAEQAGRSTEREATSEPASVGGAGAAAAGGSAAGEALRLQSAVGNRAATGVLRRAVVGRADDPAEGAADRLADQALRRLGVAPGRHSRGGGDRLGGTEVAPDVAEGIERARSGGTALPGAVRRRLESGFGADLGGVRVHTGPTSDRLARRLDSLAFAHGDDIHFRHDAYDVGSPEGEHLLAHEVAHTLDRGATVRRLLSSTQFHQATKTDWHMRGDAINAMEEVLRMYHTLNADKAAAPPARFASRFRKAKPAPPTADATAARRANAERRLDLLADLEDMGRAYLKDHATADGALTDPKRKRRMEGVRVFLDGGTFAHAKSKDAEGLTGTHTGVAAARTLIGNELIQLAGATTAATGATTTAPPTTTPATTPATPPTGATPREPVTKQAKKIKKKYEGSASSMFEVLAPVVDLAIPNPGDSLEVDVEARIPVDPNAIGFVSIHLKLSASRDAMTGDIAGAEGHDNVVLRGEALVGGGATFASLGEVKGEIGVYLESSANTAKQALLLVSYALYRRMRESAIVNAGHVSYMWTSRGGEFGYKKSEEWAKQVEREQFADYGPNDPNDAYVETGVLGGVSGKGGFSAGGVGAEIEGGLTFGGGRRYNKESIERAKGSLGGDNTSAKSVGAAAKAAKAGTAVPAEEEATVGSGRQVALSDETFFFEIAASAKMTPLELGAKIVGKFSRPTRRPGAATEAWKVDTIEAQLEGSFAIPAAGAGADLASYVIRPVSGAIAALPTAIRRAVGKAKASKAAAAKGGTPEATKAADAGAAMDTVVDQLPWVTQVAQSFGPASFELDDFTSLGKDTIADLAETGAGAASVASNLKINVAGGFNFTELSGAIEVSMAKAVEVDVPLFFSGSIVKGKRIVAFDIDRSGVKVK